MKKKKKSTDSVLKDIFDPLYKPSSAKNGRQADTEIMKEFAPERRPVIKPRKRVAQAAAEKIVEAPAPAAEIPAIPENPIEIMPELPPILDISETAASEPVFEAPVNEVPVHLPSSREKEPLFIEPGNSLAAFSKKFAEKLRQFDKETFVFKKPSALFSEETRILLRPAFQIGKFIVWTVGVVSALVVAVYVISGSATQESRLRGAHDTLKTKQRALVSAERKLPEITAKAERLKHQIAETVRERQVLNGTMNFLSAAPASQSKWAPHLAALGRLRRDGVWFERITLKNKKLMVKGFAFDQVAVIRFTTALNQTRLFKAANVVTMDETRDGSGQRIYSFEVYANVRA